MTSFMSGAMGLRFNIALYRIPPLYVGSNSDLDASMESSAIAEVNVLSTTKPYPLAITFLDFKIYFNLVW